MSRSLVERPYPSMSTHQQSKPRRANQSIAEDSGWPGTWRSKVGVEAIDVVCALSWTIHYAETAAEMEDVIGRCRRALRSGGMLILQVANDEAMSGAVNVDVEPGEFIRGRGCDLTEGQLILATG